MTDLVERLRLSAKNSEERGWRTHAVLDREAADEIERLRAREEELQVCNCTWYDIEREQQAEISRLQAERDEWKQAAGVEAGLRREFLAKIERLRAALKNLLERSSHMSVFGGTASVRAVRQAGAYIKAVDVANALLAEEEGKGP